MKFRSEMLLKSIFFTLHSRAWRLLTKRQPSIKQRKLNQVIPLLPHFVQKGEMLSRRDKLLIQPWEDRRFKDHRSKVRSALPAIDDRTPAARPHVTVKLKKCQRELDRKNKIQSDNFSLLQRLNAIMKVNRLDNHWAKPLPNFQQKVGLFFEAESLASRVTARSLPDDSDYSISNVKCYACELKKKNYEFKMLASEHREEALPPI